MLNTQKLLYILPDLAYIAELLPSKKPHTFAIQKFRQINGEFLDDNEFIAENVLKLFSKLEADTYYLILPDFLFTNTIVTTKETGDAKVKKYLKETLLPSLSISDESHEVASFVLTEFKGESKVQLSAIEKSVLAPLRVGAANAKVNIKSVLPLSWTLKSVISLEPSISVLQIGGTVYSALQYIGVDQTNQAPVAEVETIGETIKTLKGAEPSIQTIYLLANSLVEEKLKDQLSDTIPLQQLNTFKEEDAQMPSYVKEIIESGMKTLSIEEYPVPRFDLGKPTQTEIDQFANLQVKTAEIKSEDDNGVEDTVESVAETPAPDMDTREEILPPPTPKPLIASGDVSASAIPLPATDEAKKPEKSEEPVAETAQTPEPIAITPPKPEPEDEVDLTKFAQPTAASPTPPGAATVPTSSVKTPEVDVAPPPSVQPVQPKEKVVIKNSSGIAPMLKMIFITLAVFIATVAIGVGVGLGLLQFANKDKVETTPVVVTSPSPAPTTTPSPTPDASASAAIDRENLSILVVNATSKAGYAGTIKTKLTQEEFAKVTTGNAKGEYEEAANYVFFKDESTALLTVLEEATELELTESSDLEKETEDPQDQYDVVIVLAE